MPVGHSGREPVARRLGGGELFISLLKTLGRNPQLPFPLSYLSHNFRVLLGPGASMEAPVLVPALAGLLPWLDSSLASLSFPVFVILILNYLQCCFNNSGPSFAAVIYLVVEEETFSGISVISSVENKVVGCKKEDLNCFWILFNADVLPMMQICQRIFTHEVQNLPISSCYE